MTQRGIYFMRMRETKLSIEFFDFRDKTTRAIGSLEKPGHIGLSVSKDERWICYTQIDQQGSDLMLADNAG